MITKWVNHLYEIVIATIDLVVLTVVDNERVKKEILRRLILKLSEYYFNLM